MDKLTNFLTQKKEKVLREIENAKAEILEVFLCKGKLIERHLELLGREGLDRERYLCLKNYEEWEDIYYSVVDRSTLIILLTLFKEMKDEEAITRFNSVSEGETKVLLNYEEYLDMIRLSDAFNALKRAEEEIKIFYGV